MKIINFASDAGNTVSPIRLWGLPLLPCLINVLCKWKELNATALGCSIRLFFCVERNRVDGYTYRWMKENNRYGESVRECCGSSKEVSHPLLLQRGAIYGYHRVPRAYPAGKTRVPVCGTSEP